MSLAIASERGESRECLSFGSRGAIEIWVTTSSARGFFSLLYLCGKIDFVECAARVASFPNLLNETRECTPELTLRRGTYIRIGAFANRTGGTSHVGVSFHVGRMR